MFYYILIGIIVLVAGGIVMYFTDNKRPAGCTCPVYNGLWMDLDYECPVHKHFAEFDLGHEAGDLESLKNK